MLRVSLALTLLALAPLGAMQSACADDACCGESDDDSREQDECPCPDGCDDDCVCCASPAADEPPRVVLSLLPSENVAYVLSGDRSPPSAYLDGREPVPRARPQA
jgi:hypothetical protein